MQVQQHRHLFPSRTAHPALGADAPFAGAAGAVRQGGINQPRLVTGGTGRLVPGVIGDNPEIELGVGPCGEPGERREVALRTLILRHGEGDEADRPPRRGSDRVQHPNLQRQRLGLLEMLVTPVPVTQVQAHRDLGGHRIDAAREVPDDRVEDPRPDWPEKLLQDAELHRDVPLDGHLVARDRRQQPVQVGEHRPLVGGQQHLLVLGDDVGADGGERRGVLHLEADPAGDDAFLPQCGEGLIGPEVGVGVARVGPCHRGRIRSVGQPQLRHVLVVSLGRIERLHGGQPGLLQEPVRLVEDPAGPVPRFPVRNAPQAGWDAHGDLAHH